MSVRRGWGARAWSALACRALLLCVAWLLLLPGAGARAQEAAAPAAAPDSALPASRAGSEARAETASVAQQDRRIARELVARLSRIEGLREVSVQVNAGVATLRGKVPTEEDRNRAEKLVQDLEGVVDVDNRLHLDTSLAVRLRPSVERLRALAAKAVGAIPLLLLSVLLVWGMGRLSRWLGERRMLRRMVGEQPFLMGLLRQTLRFAALLLGVVIALDLLDATALVGAVIGTAGIVGLALGFALRDVVENYIAGLLLSLRQPFSPLDHVVIDGHEGKVAALTTRSTTLITLDGNHLRLPNSLVFKGVILNYTRNPQRRFTFRVGIGVGEDPVRARRIGVEALRDVPGVLREPPPMALVMELAESSVTLEYSAWLDQREAGFFQVRSEAIRTVKAALDLGGVDLPEPTYRVQIVRGADGPGREKAHVEAATESDEVSIERAVDRQVAQEQALSADVNLLKSDAPRE